MFLPAATVVVDMSSSSPHDTRELGRELRRRSVALVDAPVSGGVPRATDGTLAIMAGADEEAAVDRVAADPRSARTSGVRTGPLASGPRDEGAQQLLCRGEPRRARRGARPRSQFGLAPSTMVEIVNNSTGRSFSSEVVFTEEVVTGRYGTGFALGLLAKDVTIAAGIAEGAGVAAPVCELVQRRWAEAAQALGFAADHSMAHTQWWDVDLSDASPRVTPETARPERRQRDWRGLACRPWKPGRKPARKPTADGHRRRGHQCYRVRPR